MENDHTSPLSSLHVYHNSEKRSFFFGERVVIRQASLLPLFFFPPLPLPTDSGRELVVKREGRKLAIVLFFYSPLFFCTRRHPKKRPSLPPFFLPRKFVIQLLLPGEGESGDGDNDLIPALFSFLFLFLWREPFVVYLASPSINRNEKRFLLFSLLLTPSVLCHDFFREKEKGASGQMCNAFFLFFFLPPSFSPFFQFARPAVSNWKKISATSKRLFSLFPFFRERTRKA